MEAPGGIEPRAVHPPLRNSLEDCWRGRSHVKFYLVRACMLQQLLFNGQAPPFHHWLFRRDSHPNCPLNLRVFLPLWLHPIRIGFTAAAILKGRPSHPRLKLQKDLELDCGHEPHPPLHTSGVQPLTPIEYVGSGYRNRTCVDRLMRPSWNHLQSNPQLFWVSCSLPGHTRIFGDLPNIPSQTRCSDASEGFHQITTQTWCPRQDSNLH